MHKMCGLQMCESNAKYPLDLFSRSIGRTFRELTPDKISESEFQMNWINKIARFWCFYSVFDLQTINVIIQVADRLSVLIDA